MPAFGNPNKAKWIHKKSLRSSKNNSYSNIYKSLKFSGLKTDAKKTKPQKSILKPRQRQINLEAKTEFQRGEILAGRHQQKPTMTSTKDPRTHKKRIAAKRAHVHWKTSLAKASQPRREEPEQGHEDDWQISRLIGTTIFSTKTGQLGRRARGQAQAQCAGPVQACLLRPKTGSVESKSRGHLRRRRKQLVKPPGAKRRSRVETSSLDLKAGVVGRGGLKLWGEKSPEAKCKKQRKKEFLEHKKEAQTGKNSATLWRRRKRLLQTHKLKSKNFSATTFNLEKNAKRAKRFISRTPGALKKTADNRNFLTMLGSKSRHLSPVDPFQLKQRLRRLHLPKSSDKPRSKVDFRADAGQFEFFRTSKASCKRRPPATGAQAAVIEFGGAAAETVEFDTGEGAQIAEKSHFCGREAAGLGIVGLEKTRQENEAHGTEDVQKGREKEEKGGLRGRAEGDWPVAGEEEADSEQHIHGGEKGQKEH